jgi:hypothetical protein
MNDEVTPSVHRSSFIVHRFPALQKKAPDQQKTPRSMIAGPLEVHLGRAVPTITQTMFPEPEGPEGVEG